MKPAVYLAGQISGLTFDGAKTWRDYAIQELDMYGIAGICPMRAQEHLKTVGVLDGSHDWHVTTTSRAIMSRDFFDCAKADLVLANVLGMATASIGTTMEMAWAYQAHKPIILVEAADGIHCRHPMIAESLLYRVDNLDEALALAVAVLAAYR